MVRTHARIAPPRPSYVGHDPVADACLSGVLSLSARGQGLVAPAMLFDIPPGADIDLGDVMLRDSRNVTFRVTGRVTGGERIALQSHILDGLHPRSTRAALRSAAVDGDRAETALTAGRHAVYVHSGERVALFELDTATVRDQPIDVALQPGAPLRVRCGVNEHSGRLVVRSAWGAIVLDNELDASWERTFIVPAGAYVIDVQVGNEPPRRSQLLVPDGGAELVVP